ncbi:hypothetical protein A3SI_09478 [Nitritalea halalkaliphila LW7]|uniref:Lipoprotein n=1 Tax=Nitritalea halalkaliphila LW7 TaxID=1189621 RepID=I5C4C2_9BACT|nr:hypothetical protein [Nitritalea halalkaliphila]EIM76674.1 hypothetical protein A3SI_09478 [Nitritalea halalkaliphila LW7]
MIRNIVFLVLVFIISACSKNKPSSEGKAKSLTYVSIDLLESLGIYTIDAPVREFEGDYFILDRSQQKVARVDDSFAAVKCFFDLQESITDDNEVFGFDILGDRLFLRSLSGFTVFNLRTNALLGFHRNPFPLTQQLIAGAQSYYTTRFSRAGLEVVSFKWDDDQGFHSVSTIAEIPNSRNVIEIDQSGWLFAMDAYLVYLDEWSGEYYVMDSSKKKIITKGRLPFSGPIEENYEVDEDGFSFGTYKNAYSVSVSSPNTFWALREVDWEISESADIDLEKESDRKRIRRRVHHFNANMELIDSYVLAEIGNCIFYHDGKLFVNHTGSEKVYVYALD